MQQPPMAQRRKTNPHDLLQKKKRREGKKKMQSFYAPARRRKANPNHLTLVQDDSYMHWQNVCEAILASSKWTFVSLQTPHCRCLLETRDTFHSKKHSSPECATAIGTGGIIIVYAHACNARIHRRHIESLLRQSSATQGGCGKQGLFFIAGVKMAPATSSSSQVESSALHFTLFVH